MTEQLAHSPEQRRDIEPILTAGLDFYKLTMGQLALEKFPDTAVTFTLKNRNSSEAPLSEYVSAASLEARLQEIQTKGFTPEEIAAIAGFAAQDGTARFDEPYLDFLANLELSNVNVGTNLESGDLAVEATGPWANVSLWETVVMSEANELYYKGLIKQQGLDETALWNEGDRRLSDKIDQLRGTDIKFIDFGTRRRFSAAWQEHVVERLAAELPDNFIGTSNPWFAYKFDLAPIGTYAHEMPMVYAAVADRQAQNPLNGHNEMMHDWYARYDQDLSIALTDTFTSAFFFSDFTPEQAESWRGLRHDSGDPIDFGERAIAFYEQLGIDASEKTIVFSDGLDIDTIFTLHEHFKGRVKLVFGWGTSLTNDLGLRPNNFVMKATAVEDTPTVKLSDVAGKHTGPEDQTERYATLAAARSAVEATYKELAVV